MEDPRKIMRNLIALYVIAVVVLIIFSIIVSQTLGGM